METKQSILLRVEKRKPKKTLPLRTKQNTKNESKINDK